ncbi:ATP-binding protein [Streptomyces sp. NBC_00589]|uniref:ATP-binding protein n=2 Tax=unclassified Streptomyces TaxID=2593676 RepID=UPI002E81117C|nr:ATP-binding protein [Streptomyces sp. NBC_00589]
MHDVTRVTRPMATGCTQGIARTTASGYTSDLTSSSPRESAMPSPSVALVQPSRPPRAEMRPAVCGLRGHAFRQWVMRPTVECVPGVRARVRAVLRRQGVSVDVEDVLLLTVTELVSNAVRHAATDWLCAAITFGREWIQLDVSDGDPSLPGVGPGADVEAEGGRGLFIVDLLVAEARGVLNAFPCGAGKVVRVRIPAVR